MFRRIAVGTLLVSLAWSPPLTAQRQSAWTLAIDNDEFAYWLTPLERSDRDYSSGIELGMARPLAPRGGWDRTLVVALNHELYTPNIREPPSGTDRPYAAVLSASGSLHWERPGRRDVVGLVLAVTGPPALGEEFQRLIHRVIGSPPPVGWERQLPFEVAATVAYAGDRRVVDLGGETGLGLRTGFRFGGELGTIRSAARVGLGATLGWRPPSVWRPALPATGPGGGIRVFVPMGLRLDVVGQSLVLDGGVIARTTGVDRKTLVPRAEFGLGVELGSVTLSWMGHVTGREFETQPHWHSYGSFRLSVR